MTGTTTRRNRLLFGGRPSLWTLFVPVTFFLAGLLFAMSAGTAKGYDLRSSDAQDLPDLVRSRSRSLDEQQARADRLTTEVADLTARKAPYDAKLEPLTKKADALVGPAGLGPVEGPALEVSLDDSDRPLSSFDGAYTADDLVIHQQDVQAYVNALWAGGAEAMQIMDQRVISTSAVRCVGNTLILQGRVYSPPFTIKAVGDVAAMRAALAADPNVTNLQAYVTEVGLRIDVKDAGTQTLPAYEGVPALRHAKVVR